MSTESYLPVRPSEKVRKLKGTGAILTPFVTDEESVTLSHRQFPHVYTGHWLHTPVSVRIVPKSTSALHVFKTLSRCSHPNVEQLLAVVRGSSSRKQMIVTERLPDFTIGSVIESAHEIEAQKKQGRGHRRRTQSHSAINEHNIASVCLHTSQALLYLYATTGRGHPTGLCSHKMTFDETRARGMLLLTAVCDRCRHGSGKKTFEMRSDVAVLSQIMIKLFKVGQVESPKSFRNLLLRCADPTSKKVPSMEDFSYRLEDYRASIS